MVENNRLKKKYFLDLQVIIHTTCKFSKELFEYNPFFSKIHLVDFREDIKIDFPTIKINNYKKISNKVMPVFLSEEESKIIENIKNLGPYIAIHPFAGEDFRAWDKRIDLKNLIKKLKEKGYNVILLGGNHFREAKIIEQRENREELFEYEQEGFYNFTNHGVRLCFAAVNNSAYFIGSSSAYSTAAWCLGKKSLSIVPDGQFLKPTNWWYKSLHEKSTVLRFENIDNIYYVLDEFLS